MKDRKTNLTQTWQEIHRTLYKLNVLLLIGGNEEARNSLSTDILNEMLSYFKSTEEFEICELIVKKLNGVDIYISAQHRKEIIKLLNEKDN
jgi:cyanophycinase-like exopeptidase